MKTKPRQTIRLPSPKQVGMSPRPLRLTPYAWRKLLFLRDFGPTEVGGFGISAPDDLLLIEDISLVRQKCSPVTVKFDDQAVADHFDDYVDLDYAVERFARIWVHTHPGDSASPSSKRSSNMSVAPRLNAMAADASDHSRNAMAYTRLMPMRSTIAPAGN